MPNICTANLNIRGYKDNVDEFLKILQADYDYYKMEFTHNKHFYRVFQAEVYNDEIYGVTKFVSAFIECAWSVACCMFDDAYTYYNESTIITKDMSYEDKEFAAQHIIHSTCIEREAKRLNLDIEIISEEPGIGFREHYLFYEGDLKRDDCVSYEEYYIGDSNTKEEYEEDFGCKIPLTEEEFQELKDAHADTWSPQDPEEFEVVLGAKRNEPSTKQMCSIQPPGTRMCKVVNNSKRRYWRI